MIRNTVFEKGLSLEVFKYSTTSVCHPYSRSTGNSLRGNELVTWKILLLHRFTIWENTGVWVPMAFGPSNSLITG